MMIAVPSPAMATVRVNNVPNSTEPEILCAVLAAAADVVAVVVFAPVTVVPAAVVVESVVVADALVVFGLVPAPDALVPDATAALPLPLAPDAAVDALAGTEIVTPAARHKF